MQTCDRRVIFYPSDAVVERQIPNNTTASSNLLQAILVIAYNEFSDADKKALSISGLQE